MKIRTRLSLLFVLCSTVSLLLCGVLLLCASAKTTIRSVENNAVSELNMLTTSFSSAANKSMDRDSTDAVRRSLAVYVFQSYAENALSESQYILKRGGETLYNNSGWAPDAILGGLGQNTVTWQGEKLFVACTETDLMREGYQIYLIRNMTSVYDSISNLRRQFALICVLAVFFSAALILWTTSRMLRPLKTLEKEAAAMANGEYRGRIALSERSLKRKDEIATVSDSFNRMADAVEQHIDAVTAVAEERKMLIGALTHEIAHDSHHRIRGVPGPGQADGGAEGRSRLLYPSGGEASRTAHPEDDAADHSDRRRGHSPSGRIRPSAVR